ncbi:MAG: type VI secretion system tip protein TssI/VgrG [Minicystis sp.]
MAGNRATFEIHAGAFGPEDLAVVSFTGTESLSKPYRFDVLVAVRAAGPSPEEILGARARLVMHGVPESRVVAGVLARVGPEAAQGPQEEHYYALRLVSSLWLLGRKKTSRVFQNLTTPEIVSAVLRSSGIEHDLKLARSYPKREYCLQYQESDLHFVNRLLAEAGIFYFFRQPPAGRAEDGEIVVLADQPAHYEAIAGGNGLSCRDAGDLATTEHVRVFSARHEVRTAAVTLKGFDFKRPAFDLSADVEAPSGPGVRPDLGAYDHDEDLVEGNIDEGATRTRLEQLRAAARVGSGSSVCRRLMPGAAFDLEDHPIHDLNRRWAVTAIEHRGQEASGRHGHPLAADRTTYENDFRVVPADVPSRPKRPRRRAQQVLETATVVGPPGEEIHTDEHGRVKVQFHWDREGRRDDRSSCWIRTMQPWAGSAWGAQFIPRVGMEVVVSFLAGDVDRPMVLGAVYNGVNPPPFPLPANKTQSGIRTQSTPGGGGSNELRFEDAAGREQVYLHAERNLDEVVENDHTSTVRGLEVITVDKSRMVEVAEDNIRTVLGNEVVTVHKNLVVHVIGNQLIQVDGVQPSGEASSSTSEEAKPASPAEDALASLLEDAEPPPEPAEAKRAAEIRSAKLLWLGEQLDPDAYPIGQIVLAQVKRIDLQTEEIARGAAGVAQAASALAARAEAGAPGEAIARGAARVLERAAVIDRRARFAREAIAYGIEDNRDPAGPLVRLQEAAIAQLEANAERLARVRADVGRASAEAAFLVARARGGDLAGGSGRGGGGGTSGVFDPADVKFKDYRDSAGQSTASPTGLKGSKLAITGGGEISSPQGFKIDCGGSSIEITPGSISITSSGPITINGAPIKLNC